MTGWREQSRGRIIPEHCATQTVQRVCVAETDMMGVVHHANYVAYFEKGRLEYLRRRGLPYKEMVERGYHMPVVELNLRYRKPAHFDDLLSVETRLGALSRVTARFNYTVRRPKLESPLEPPELLLEGYVLLACVDEKNRPRPLPEDVVRTLFLPEISQTDDLVLAGVVSSGSRAGRAGNV
jgi:acyl-CoA thioester hydrolase